MLHLRIILISIFKHKFYNIAKQYKDISTNNNSNRH
jgi:hypothetical protein